MGSGCTDASVLAETTYLAHKLFQMAQDLGFNLTLLDVGGGFPGDNTAALSFEEVITSTV